MGNLNDVAQKIKGKAQQIKGDYQIQTGNELKGNLTKAKGKINEKIADTNIENDSRH